MLKTLVVAGAVGVAWAACPNSCSGHGTCSQNDLCTCYANWQGSDCSLRTCPSGNSWALDSSAPHAYEECSGAGLCDRASGECKCFDGYSGAACQRRACPNDCSGHGVCRTLAEVKTSVAYPAGAWDADKIQTCVCDAGYFGTDCSMRRCPTGDDPLTLCSSTVTGQVQQIKLTLGSALNHYAKGSTAGLSASDEGMELFGVSDAMSFDVVREAAEYAQLRVGTTDAAGSIYYAPTAAKAAFSASTKGAQSLEVALESIPGFKVRNVVIASEQTNPITGAAAAATDKLLEQRYLVSFVPYEDSSSNYGLQPALTCDSAYSCSSAGCSPLVRMPFLYRYAAAQGEKSALGTVSGNTYAFFTGTYNTAASFNSGSFVRLADSSMPRLPVGGSIDTGITDSSDSRYDLRIVIAVQDPKDGMPDDAIDVYWTKVTYGHNNISTDGFEYATGTSKGPWSSSNAANFAGSLLGFSYRGFIPSTKTASIPEAPGVVLQFPSTNLVTSGNFRFFEILVKLPSCSVTPLVTGTEFAGVGGAALAPVDANVENMECSGRGECNRENGLCECANGYFGPGCSRQSVLV